VVGVIGGGCESKIGTLLAEVMVLMVESKNSRSKK